VAAPQAPQAQIQPRGWWSLFTEFLWQGVLHILIGLDHILFVLVLLVAVRSFKELGGVVTSFTLAHSVTLALGALGLANPEPSLVESVIALSIVYVAVENMTTEEPRARYVVTFFFGLVHGFGFSGVLRDLGLPQEGLVPSLLAFNLGVELGQLAIVAPLFPLVMWVRRRDKRWGRRLALGLSLPVLIIAVLWFIERAFDVSILPEVGG
jgi:hydrogenase/urease accessory protein HupE